MSRRPNTGSCSRDFHRTRVKRMPLRSVTLVRIGAVLLVTGLVGNTGAVGQGPTFAPGAPRLEPGPRRPIDLLRSGMWHQQPGRAQEGARNRQSWLARQPAALKQKAALSGGSAPRWEVNL